jgi:glycosyltransferase involved in cell wall biosynthesis
MEALSEGTMLRGHHLVYFGPDTWDGLWRTRQQIMSMFATQNKVLFVEGRPRLRKTLAGFRRGDLGLSDLRRPTVRRISANLHVFRYPLWTPESGRFPLGQLTKIAGRLALRRALRELQAAEPIVWFHRPSMIDLINEVPSPRLLLYHVVDEYTTYGGVTPDGRRRMEEQEKTMMSLVDAVIVVSEKLFGDKRPFNPNTYLVPNGVNYQAFSAALADPQLPDDLWAIRRPRLGYVGLIGSKLNLSMLYELAQQDPEWSLVLVGDVSRSVEGWQALLAMPNVHHLGPVDGTQVPYYVKGFDVGLMPYEQNRHADYIDPMKLYDYLAAGIPVVSLDIPAVHRFSEHIHIAGTPQDFARAVRAALADTAPERRQARREVAAQNSWEARIEQLSDIIQAQLQAKRR